MYRHSGDTAIWMAEAMMTAPHSTEFKAVIDQNSHELLPS
jgi:hypothetical protein